MNGISKLKLWAVKTVVGKNLPHLGRLCATLVGAFILAGPLYDAKTEALDPAVQEGAEQIQVPDATTVAQDPTVGTGVQALLGVLLIWGSRVVSWLRAKNLPSLAKWCGWLIGRSLPSMGRSILVVGAGMLARFTAQQEMSPEDLAGTPLAAIFASVLAVMAANLWSAIEDGKRNPVESDAQELLRL